MSHIDASPSNKNTINVQNFGAIGDGSTDDSSAFQKAIDYLNALGGGTLVVPNNTYMVQNKVYAFKNRNQVWIQV